MTDIERQNVRKMCRRFLADRLMFLKNNDEEWLNDTKNEKVLFKTDVGQLKRFSSKIIKMDENNQYGQAMTKPLPCGCIKKKKKVLSLEELPALLKSVTLDDNIGHIFTLDMELSDINPKTLLFNETYLPIFEKNKEISQHKRSTSQIMSRKQKKKTKMKFQHYLLIVKRTQLYEKKYLLQSMPKICFF